MNGSVCFVCCVFDMVVHHICKPGKLFQSTLQWQLAFRLTDRQDMGLSSWS